MSPFLLVWLAVMVLWAAFHVISRRRAAGVAPAEEPDDPDGAVLARIGSDSLGQPHDVEFFLYFPTMKSATEAATRIREESFDAKVERAVRGNSWLCLATKRMSLDLATLRRVRSDFTEIAHSVGGEYDGWGASVAN